MSARKPDAVARSPWAPPAAKPPLSARMMRATWRGLPAKRHEVGWEPGLAVPSAEGGPLLTDHYFPRAEGDFPTLLVRSPYGRGLPWSPLYGLLFAEQGFHVVLQSCRGTGGSAGTFDLWRNEAADGRATVAWLREQPWFNGRLGTVGASYLGHVQWALALDPPPELKAMVVQVGLHDPHAFFHGGGVLHLENALVSGVGMTYQHRGTRTFLKALLRLRRRVREISTARPPYEPYTSGLGAETAWLEEALTRSDADDPFWQGTSAGEAAERLRVPTGLITGWYDALADQTFDQYGRLRAAGCETALLVGPWTHTSAFQQGLPEVFGESLAWLRAHLEGDSSGLRPTRVRVHVGGEDAWQDLDDWPSDPATTSWYPTTDGCLVPQTPTDSAPLTSFRYDPTDPTPSLGGPLLSRTAGPRDNNTLEARDDVLTFTTPPLTKAVDVLGPVTARLTVSTDTGHTHVFARLCDVDPQGRSVNLCDGLGVLKAASQESAQVSVEMGATAHRFAVGHRIRWQISGGAHPRYASSDAGPAQAPARITLHTGSELLLPSGSGVA
ncbi:CocE/NonD family hydrolase [Streptomyces sp. NPDC042319]|uniref:CocE/NonD family hydrolase n=1 Tax=Streptomyces sp. NPDC042319 TaxID=3154332 RepID=UPI0033C421A7